MSRYCKHGAFQSDCNLCDPIDGADLSAADCSASSARREVIENKLLAALDDEGKVAILATEIDLILFVKAMVFYDTPDSHEMAKDLLQLKRSAFPQNALAHPIR